MGRRVKGEDRVKATCIPSKGIASLSEMYVLWKSAIAVISAPSRSICAPGSSNCTWLIQFDIGLETACALPFLVATDIVAGQRPSIFQAKDTRSQLLTTFRVGCGTLNWGCRHSLPF